MRRPPLACRRAVHSLQPSSPQHVWISEDLLSSSFQRFVRNSCPQQKRHGSHVPGPLEARRRASKRRMTVSAGFHPPEGFITSFSLGALFGFRGKRQPAWRYEPPSLQAEAGPLESAEDPTHSAQSHQAPASPTTLANTSTTQYQTHRLEADYAVTQSSSKTIQTASTGLLSETSQDTPEEEAAACFDAFRMRLASANQEEKQKIHAFIRQAFKECRPASSAVPAYTVLILRHMVELDLDPVPVLAQHNDSSFALPALRFAETPGFLTVLERVLEKHPQHVGAIHSLYRRLVDSVLVAPATFSSIRSKDKHLTVLLRHVWRGAHRHGAAVQMSVCDLLQFIAQRIGDKFRRRHLLATLVDPGTIGEMFLARIAESPSARLPVAVDLLSCVPITQLVQYIPAMVLYQLQAPSSRNLLAWLSLTHELDSRLASPTTSLMDIAMSTLTKHVFLSKRATVDSRLLLSAVAANALRTGSVQRAWSPRVLETLNIIQSAVSADGRVTLGASIEALSSHLLKAGLPHEPIMQELFTLVARHAELGYIVPLLRALRRNRVFLDDVGLLQQRVAAQIATLERSTTDTVEETRRHNRTLHICKTISRLLIAICPASIAAAPPPPTRAQRQFAFILMRAQADHALPLAYHNLTTPLSTTASIQLIHHLAHQYSTDYTRTQRQAWRATYFLYKYLRTNALDIGPLFSKAVVRVSIIRPMSENCFVSARRLIWVCDLVARVEGESVARQLEADFWDWRGDLFRHAKAVYVGVGGNVRDKAHVGTMKRLGLI